MGKIIESEEKFNLGEMIEPEEKFKVVHYNRKIQNEVYQYPIDFLNQKQAELALDFHKSIKGYRPTPLQNLKGMATVCGIADMFVKDESYRLELNAFKVLGGAYAIARYIASQLGENIADLPFKRMISDEIKNKLGEITFVTATDGNHGRGVAWAASKLKQHSVVYMPKGSSPERLEKIKELGADASITEFNYDRAVAHANEMAEKNGWVIVQDTAWEGYKDIPVWIMQGYETMALETFQQMNGIKPTHIFLQAGVGSMASAVTGFYSNLYGNARPIITIVEPSKADCFYRTAKTGKIEFVTGDMDTIMAGLACGEPNTIGWEVLKNWADNFVSCPDYVTAKGMRMLASGIDGDPKVISGESGAVTTGLVAEVMLNPDLKWLHEKLSLGENSRVLVFSTEGDTDKKAYRNIVWDGEYPSYSRR